MQDVSVIEVNVTRLGRNLNVLREMVGPDCRLCPILKADAYGLGAISIARHMARNGVDMVAVYSPAQAAELRAAGIDLDVLVLMPVRDAESVDDLARGIADEAMHFALHDLAQVKQLAVIAQEHGTTLPVHLEVDTGMSRGGCSCEEARRILQSLVVTPSLRLAGIYSHFARAENDEAFTDAQAREFDELMSSCAAFIPPDCDIHLSGTYATLRSERHHRTMVRIGLAWAGCGLELMSGSEHLPMAESLQPIVTWASRIVQVKSIPAGAGVGYGSTWTARRPSFIGLVPVGYADGYPMQLSAKDGKPNGASIAVFADRNGDRSSRNETGGEPHYAPVIGSVNMDQIVIDLTDVASAVVAATGRMAFGSGAGTSRRATPHAAADLLTGARVEIISANPTAPNHLIALSRLAGTIPHELLCRLNPRVKRSYVMTTADAESHTVARVG